MPLSTRRAGPIILVGSGLSILASVIESSPHIRTRGSGVYPIVLAPKPERSRHRSGAGARVLLTNETLEPRARSHSRGCSVSVRSPVTAAGARFVLAPAWSRRSPHNESLERFALRWRVADACIPPTPSGPRSLVRHRRSLRSIRGSRNRHAVCSVQASQTTRGSARNALSRSGELCQNCERPPTVQHVHVSAAGASSPCA